jgi:cell wall-associated NlpC family hydrolase
MLRKQFPLRDSIAAIAVLVVVAATALAAQPAAAKSGGIGPDGTSGKPGKAKLKRNGKAVPPKNAPKRVRKAIRAGNKIRRKPYKWGGGHGRWNDKGYDCSGAVSYVLKGANMLNRPRASGGLMKWRKRGKGKWITVYAHGGHAFIIVAGLRFDTSGTGGNGPRWHKQKRSRKGFKARRYSKRF